MRKKRRAKTEQLVGLIVDRINILNHGQLSNVSVREIKETLLLEFGRDRTPKHIRRLLRNMEGKRTIRREFYYPYFGKYGDKAQAKKGKCHT